MSAEEQANKYNLQKRNIINEGMMPTPLTLGKVTLVMSNSKGRGINKIEVFYSECYIFKAIY